MRKDANREIVFTFLDWVCDSLFKCRLNLIEQVSNVKMIKHILAPPSATRNRKLNFDLSGETIDNLSSCNGCAILKDIFNYQKFVC